MNYWVYIVKCSNEGLYTGITTDVESRIEQHNGLKPGGAKYTRSHRPVVLVYTEEYPSKSDALKRELEIKKMSHTEKKNLIGQNI